MKLFQPPSEVSLVRLLSQRLVMTAVVAIVLQIGITAVRSYFDEIDLNTNYIKYEVRLIAAAYDSAQARRVPVSQWLPQRYVGTAGKSYGFRIIGADGRVLADHNGAMLAALSPWRFPNSDAQDFWFRRLDGTAWMNVAGGVHFERPTGEMWVEVVTFGDPAGAHVGIFARELVADVWMPMIALIALMLGVAILTVRSALAPLVHAAHKADTLAVLERNERLDVERLPREAASLAAAINRLLDRVAELVTSQRQFLARAAHELRTPLSIMLLELGRSEGPRVERLQADVGVMSDMVDRLLTLAKLESSGKPEFSDVDLAQFATGISMSMADWAMQTGHRIEVRANGSKVIRADKFALREAIRNLVENAIKHTPAGAKIEVEIGPGARIAVDDAGTGIDEADHAKLLEPFARGSTKAEGSGLGLAIVAQAVALHHAELKISRSHLGGARFEIIFPEDEK